MSNVAERYAAYYRDILKRIADGYPTPASIADLAINWRIHSKACAFENQDYDECSCGAEEFNPETLEINSLADIVYTPPKGD